MLTFLPTRPVAAILRLPKPSRHMSATAEMPYFVRPSIHLSPAVKRAAYVELRAAAQATLFGETDRVVRQATLACLIKTYLPYAYWVGFYDLKHGMLKIGPYQGTLGCISIELGKGVCGRVAVSGKTIIEVDVHALQEGTVHIACDPNSCSEIVVPCFSESGQLFAVLDIDSTEAGTFDEIDRVELEDLIKEVFGRY